MSIIVISLICYGFSFGDRQARSPSNSKQILKCCLVEIIF